MTSFIESATRLAETRQRPQRADCLSRQALRRKTMAHGRLHRLPYVRLMTEVVSIAGGEMLACVPA